MREQANIYVHDIVISSTGRWIVRGLEGSLVVLASEDGTRIRDEWISGLRADPEFLVIPGDVKHNRPLLPDHVTDLAMVDTCPPDEIEKARRLYGHIQEVLTGWPGGHPEEGLVPWPHFSPTRSVGQLDKAMVKQIAATEPDLKISLRQFADARRVVQSGSGLAGLIDHRRTKVGHEFGRTDPRVIDTLQQMWLNDLDRSAKTDGYFLTLLPVELEARYPDEWAAGEIRMPSKATFYRDFNKIKKGRSRLFSAKARRAEANVPEPATYSQLRALHPYHMVLLDTTPIDVLAFEGGKSITIEATIGLNWYGRSIVAWKFHKVGAKDVDIGGVIGRIITPEPMREGWKENRRINYSTIPLERTLSLDEWFDAAVALPTVWPQTIVVDRGRPFYNRSMLERCSQLGICVQPCRPYTPTDKAAVESTFKAINVMFSQFVAGYKGSNVLMRGRHVKAFWSMAQIEELFAEFVITIWQNHRHDGLRSEWDPSLVMTPNEKFAEGVAIAGYLPVSASGDLYTLMLPTKWLQVTDKGIKLMGLRYNSPDLNDLRNKVSGIGGRGLKWPVRWDERQRQLVWLVDHRNDDIIEVKFEHIVFASIEGTRATFEECRLDDVAATLSVDTASFVGCRGSWSLHGSADTIELSETEASVFVSADVRRVTQSGGATKLSLTSTDETSVDLSDADVDFLDARRVRINANRSRIDLGPLGDGSHIEGVIERSRLAVPDHARLSLRSSMFDGITIATVRNARANLDRNVATDRAHPVRGSTFDRGVLLAHSVVNWDDSMPDHDGTLIVGGHIYHKLGDRNWRGLVFKEAPPQPRGSGFCRVVGVNSGALVLVEGTGQTFHESRRGFDREVIGVKPDSGSHLAAELAKWFAAVDGAEAALFVLEVLRAADPPD